MVSGHYMSWEALDASFLVNILSIVYTQTHRIIISFWYSYAPLSSLSPGTFALALGPGPGPDLPVNFMCQ